MNGCKVVRDFMEDILPDVDTLDVLVDEEDENVVACSVDGLLNEDVTDIWIKFPRILYPYKSYGNKISPERRFIIGNLFETPLTGATPYHKINTHLNFETHLKDENIFDLEQINISYLTSKPLCIFLAGIPVPDIYELGRAIAESYGCVYVDALGDISGEESSFKGLESTLKFGKVLPYSGLLAAVKGKLESDVVQDKGYILCGLPFTPETNDCPTVTEQMDMIKTLHLQPDFIIYMKCPELDILSKLQSNSFEFSTLVQRADCESLFINPYTCDQIKTIKTYVNTVEPVLFEYIVQVDPQFVIQVDARLSVQKMLDMVLAKLDVLPFHKPCLARALIKGELTRGESPEKQADEVAIEEFVEINEDDNRVIALLSKDSASSKYKWNISSWGVYCPVSVSNGLFEKGKLENCMQFLDKLYFLSNSESVNIFAENPRRYLVPPEPRFPKVVAIVGPPLYGKTLLSQCLGKLLGVEVVNCGELYARRFGEINFGGEFDEEGEVFGETTMYSERDIWKGESSVDVGEHLEGGQVNPEYDVENEFAMNVEWDLADEDEEEGQAEDDDLDEISSYCKEIVHEIVSKTDDKKTGVILDGLPGDFLVWKYFRKINLLPDVVICLTDSSPQHSFMLNIFNLMKRWNDLDLFVADYIMNLSSDYLKCFINLSEFLQLGILEESLESFYRTFPGDKDNFLNKTLFAVKEEDNEDHATSDIHQTSVDSEINIVVKQNNNVVRSTAERNFVNYVKNFSQQYLDLTLKLNFVRVNIDVVKKSLSLILLEIVTQLDGLTRQKARAISESEFKTKSEQMGEGSKNIIKERKKRKSYEIIFGHISDYDFSNVELGYLDRYCPVALKNQQVVRLGDIKHAVSYGNKTFLCSSEESRNVFLMNPHFYGSEKRQLQQLPPLKVFIVGPIGSNSSAIAEMVANESYMFWSTFMMDVNNSVVPVGCKKVGRRTVTDPVTSTPIADSLRRCKHHFVLNDHFIKGTPLSDTLLYDIIKTSWHNSNIQSLDFIYEGFPRTADQIDFMETYGIIPDLIVEIQTSVSSAISMHYQEYVDMWNLRQHQCQNQLYQLEQSLLHMLGEQGITNARSDDRLEEMLAEEPHEHGKSEEEEEEAEEEEEGEEEGSLYDSDRSQVFGGSMTENLARNITQEFQKRFSLDETQALVGSVAEQLATGQTPVFVCETEKAARKRIRNHIIQWHKMDLENIEKLRKSCYSKNIPWVRIKGQGETAEIVKTIVECVKDARQISPKSLEVVEGLSLNQAQQLLDRGYAFLSKFGKWCPVQLFEKRTPFQMYYPNTKLGSEQNCCPVMHRKLVYFIIGHQNKRKFMKDPLKYIAQGSPPPIIPYRLAIIGPPGVGKSTLANRLAAKYGFKIITVENAVNYVNHSMPGSFLSSAQSVVLGNSASIKCELYMSAVEAATMDERCVTQGTIFDGMPTTVSEVKLLYEMGLFPYRIVLILGAESFCRENYLASNTDRCIKDFEKAWNCWINNSCPLLGFISHNYYNLSVVDGTKSRWHVFTTTEDIISINLKNIQNHHKNYLEQKPASLESMCVTAEELSTRSSHYLSYCPVCLIIEKKLVQGGMPPNRSQLVHYCNYFYWICNRHLDTFMSNPEVYVNSDVELPHNLPKILTIEDILEKYDSYPVRDKGVCIVSYANALPACKIVQGSPQYSVFYKNEVFYFANPKCQSLFLESPQKFYVTDVLVNPDVLQVQQLSPQFVVERDFYKPLMSAFRKIICDRPFYPNFDGQTSAAVYVKEIIKNFKLRGKRAFYLFTKSYYQELAKELPAFYKDILSNMQNGFLYCRNKDGKELEEQQTSEENENVCVC